MFGGIELGGTKVVGMVGTGPDAILDTTRIETAGPGETIEAAVAFLRRAMERGIDLAAIGVGSFGPVELRPGQPGYGAITTTPKPAWQGTDVVGPFRALGLPVGFDTDVNAAALAEWTWGAGRGLCSFVYLTLGTGIGGGAVVGGTLAGGLGHPEMGHIAVPRMPGDEFAGVCPYHGDCLEGMASGPAVAARFALPADCLEGPDRAAAVRLVAGYVAAGIRSIVYVLGPERVILGGGLSAMPGLVAAVGEAVADGLRGYPGLTEHRGPGFVVRAGLGDMAGPLGTLVLAERALGRAAPG
jgi:fructokinase